MREPTDERVTPGVGGTQRRYQFENGWAASVVRHSYSYGGAAGFWELAVLEGIDGPLNYSTPITKDVIGWLTDEEVDEILSEIEALPSREGETT